MNLCLKWTGFSFLPFHAMQSNALLTSCCSRWISSSRHSFPLIGSSMRRLLIGICHLCAKILCWLLLIFIPTRTYQKSQILHLLNRASNELVLAWVDSSLEFGAVAHFASEFCAFVIYLCLWTKFASLNNIWPATWSSLNVSKAQHVFSKLTACYHKRTKYNKKFKVSTKLIFTFCIYIIYIDH